VTRDLFIFPYAHSPATRTLTVSLSIFGRFLIIHGKFKTLLAPAILWPNCKSIHLPLPSLYTAHHAFFLPLLIIPSSLVPGQAPCPAAFAPTIRPYSHNLLLPADYRPYTPMVYSNHSCTGIAGSVLEHHRRGSTPRPPRIVGRVSSHLTRFGRWRTSIRAC
jgi:hypothetical protein